MSFNEIVGNIFDLDEEYSLAISVSRDLKMSKGISRRFRLLFGGREALGK